MSAVSNEKTMSTVSNAEELLGTGHALASALAAYAATQDRWIQVWLLNLTQPNSPQREWLLSPIKLDASDIHVRTNITGLLFTETLFQEKRGHSFLRELAPTAAKLAIVIEFLKGLSADDADQLATAFHDGSVRKLCDSLKAGRSEAGEAAGAEQSEEGNASAEFIECVFKAVAAIVDDHSGITHPKSYVTPLTKAIKAVARSHIDSAVDSIKPSAERLALDLHRACRRYGAVAGGFFAHRARSTAHMIRGLREAFDARAVQYAVAFMVKEQDGFLFGTKNLEPRLANLLLIATKQLTGSSTWYEPHCITQEQESEAEATAVEAEATEAEATEAEATEAEATEATEATEAEAAAVEASLASAPFAELLRIVRSPDSAAESVESVEAAEEEIKRREMLCCAVRHILCGRYHMPNKGRGYCGFVRFNSAAPDVRNESLLRIASFAFSEQDAATIATALAELLCPCSGADALQKSLTEMCGLSLDHGPMYVRQAEYSAHILDNEPNVEALIGARLKAKLRSIDPYNWDFAESATAEAGRQEQVELSEEPIGPARKRIRV